MWAAVLAVVCIAPVQAASGPQGGPSIESLWLAADSHEALGNLLEASRALESAQQRAISDEQRAATALRHGIVLVKSGELDAAAQQLDRAAALGSSLSALDRFRVIETSGALEVRRGNLSAAERAFGDAAAGYAAAGERAAELRARTNLLRARMDARRIEGLEERLAELLGLAEGLAPGEDSALLLLAVGDLHRRAINEFRSPGPLAESAYACFARALEYTQRDTTRGYALGFLGALYEDARRWEEARRLTAQALFLAQGANARDQIYRWEWQLGRIDRAVGALPESASSMGRAVAGLSGIRDDLLQTSRQSFSTLIEPVYLDYADSSLRLAAGMAADSDPQQRVLRSVRDQLESLKQAEMQDYFEDECVAADAARGDGSFRVPGAAVIYPVLLADRVEVLVETGGVLRRHAVDIPRGQVTATARALRLGLERPAAGDAYLQPAQSLYRWLLADVEPWLLENGVDTLVFVPSGALRTIPLGALHDGRQFVVERFKVATTPAVSLLASVDPAQFERLLVAGISESVQGFSELPGVTREVQALSSLFPGQELKNATFRLAAIEQGLSSSTFTVAHLATHGEFSADHRQSFVLTYDDRLTMDRLQKSLGLRRDSPLDLLVLSACKTAAGDDRAALGLAGVAVQAGARSAVASLWYISDAATANLMEQFYQNLRAGGTSKAESLQAAQLTLLRTEEFQHPSYWAPYLLIGNWM